MTDFDQISASGTCICQTGIVENFISSSTNMTCLLQTINEIEGEYKKTTHKIIHFPLGGSPLRGLTCPQDYFLCGQSRCLQNTSYNIENYRECGKNCIHSSQTCNETCPDNFFICGKTSCKQNTTQNIEKYQTCGDRCLYRTQQCNGTCLDKFFRCGTNNCMENTTYNIQNYRECGDLCLSNSQPCNSTTNITTITTNATTTTTTATSETTTTTSTTTTTTKHFKPKWLMRGDKVTDTENPIIARNVKVCWSKCEEILTCNFISWSKKAKKCTLFKTYKGGKKKNGCFSGPIPDKTTTMQGMFKHS